MSFVVLDPTHMLPNLFWVRGEDVTGIWRMVASAVFILDLKGKVIISRNYRGDVPMFSLALVTRVLAALSDARRRERKKKERNKEARRRETYSERKGGTGGRREEVEVGVEHEQTV